MEDKILTVKYRKLDRDLALFSYRLSGNGNFENSWFVPSPENMVMARMEFMMLKERFSSLSAPDAAYEALKNHFGDFIESLEFILNDLENCPVREILDFTNRYLAAARIDRRDDRVKLSVITGRLQQYISQKDLLLRLCKDKMSKKALCDTASALLDVSKSAEYETGELSFNFPGLSDEERENLKASLMAFSVFAKKLSQNLYEGKEGISAPGTVEDDLSKTVKMDAEEYRSLLKSRLGVDLSELLSWGSEETGKTRAEVFEIAERLTGGSDVPKDMEEVNALLFKNEPAAKDADEMFERARGYLQRARKVAHEYVNLPEDEEVQCVPIPFALKGGYPWGGYEGGDFRTRPLKGQMFLNQYNVPNISDGWIRMNAMHEAYPGHHVQYVRAAIDPTPETVKIGARLIPLLEGTCIRTERAFEDTYPDDPYYPLFVAYRRHHTSVRILVDLKLFYYGCTIGEAVDIYKKELGLDFVTARTQVQAHLNSPGYFTCYYYGLKKISSIEEELGFSKKDFTEILFSSGYVSMETFEKIARMTEEERNRFFTGFPSVLREDENFDPGASMG